MNLNENSVHHEHYTPQEAAVVNHLISAEKAALDKWFKGDVSGYEALWSKRSFTYFDATTPKRVENHETIEKFLKSIAGKLFAASYDFRSPRVQLGKGMAVLTFQLFAKTNLIDMEYNCVEVFQKEIDDQWRVIHSTWSFIRPMDKDFKAAPTVV